MRTLFRNARRSVARSIGARSIGEHSIGECIGSGLRSVTVASLISSAATTPLAAQGLYIPELPPDFPEPAAGPPLPACVNRLRSLGSPVEFSVITTYDAGFGEFYISGRLFRAGPAQPYSNLAASGLSISIYLDGFVSVEDTRQHSIIAFRGECLGDQLMGSNGTEEWVFSFGSRSAGAS